MLQKTPYLVLVYVCTEHSPFLVKLSTISLRVELPDNSPKYEILTVKIRLEFITLMKHFNNLVCFVFHNFYNCYTHGLKN